MLRWKLTPTEVKRNGSSPYPLSLTSPSMHAIMQIQTSPPTVTGCIWKRDIITRSSKQAVWFGYNFSTGEKLKVEMTPMFGGVFGDITGIAPGYTIAVRYKSIELSVQGEYFFDSGTSFGDFFYNWSELSASPADWFRIGIVIERTQASGFSSDVRRGPLIGFKYKEVDLTTYWLAPGSNEATFVFAVTFNF
jgi:hypothetical protein